jgi:hypothetical protein
VLAGRLVHMIEDYAEQLTCGLMAALQRGPRTSKYHIISHAEMQHRVFEREAPWRASFGGRGLRFGAAASRTTEDALR